MNDLHVVRGSRDESAAAQSDRKSTRLNSNHLGISYAVFCLKKIPTPLRQLRGGDRVEAACGRSHAEPSPPPSGPLGGWFWIKCCPPPAACRAGCFFFNNPPPPGIYSLPLHGALPI